LPAELKIPMIAATDIGRLAAMAFLNPDKFPDGQSIPISGDIISGSDFAASFSRISNRSAFYEAVPLDMFEKQTFPGVKQIAEMYRWYINTNGGHRRNVTITREFLPGVQSVDQWMNSEGLEAIQQAL